MSNKAYYTLTTKKEMTEVAYIEIHDSDSNRNPSIGICQKPKNFHVHTSDNYMSVVPCAFDSVILFQSLSRI